jgi:hypothetical protein
MKELPISDMSFREIIESDLLYVDKTGYLSSLLKSHTKSCFLSRPRRFGKTLLLDTIEELFLGHKELFRGLKIEPLGYEFPKHPVVRLRMNYAKESQQPGKTGVPHN